MYYIPTSKQYRSKSKTEAERAHYIGNLPLIQKGEMVTGKCQEKLQNLEKD